jgi:1,2-diacylglycerol 3-beta-glucosyltransferase
MGVSGVVDALYHGLPLWAAALFSVAFAVIVINALWSLWLFTLARRQDDNESASGDQSAYLWVFLVPALNEEVTIVDAVTRLLNSRCSNRRVVVVNDGSDDNTAGLLDGIHHPDLVVLTRSIPLARQGKAAALNYGWRQISSRVANGDFEGFNSQNTIICVVDADGRLDPGAPGFLAEWFDDPMIGGVQIRVRIYNRTNLLTRCQDIEFGIYGRLFQAARARLGIAGMGGNGQFNRLAALDDLAVRNHDRVPWRDRLTEDQDLGIRLLQAGWRCGHDNRVEVNQQGLPDLRRLFRQRTRWSQGNLQAMSVLPMLRRFPQSRRARLDLHLWLLQPIAQALVGVAFVSAVIIWATRHISFLPTNWVMVVVFYLLGFSGVVLGSVALCGRGPKAWLSGLLLGTFYAAYTWLLWPVLVRSTYRQLRSLGGWAKTERVVIEDNSTGK